jgi:hypothetical protein
MVAPFGWCTRIPLRGSSAALVEEESCDQKEAADFASVDEVADYVEKLVEGWASVIR